MIGVNLLAIAAIFVALGERLSWARYGYIEKSKLNESEKEIKASKEY